MMPVPRLLDRLVADAVPVRRLWPRRARIAAWLMLQLVCTAVIVSGLPANPLARVTLPSRLLETAGLVALSLALAATAVGAAVPGNVPSRRTVLLLVVLGVGMLVPALADPVHADVSLADFVYRGLGCAAQTLTVALVPALALLVLVRRGAPLRPRLAAAAACGAALVAAHAVVRLACPLEDALHVAGWHVLPVWGGIVLGASLGAWWLDRWRATPVAPAPTDVA